MYRFFSNYCSISLEQVEQVERFNWSQNDILGGGGQFSQISKIACGEWMYRRQKKCFGNLKVFKMVRFTPISMHGISYGSFRKSGGSEMWSERYKDDYSEGKNENNSGMLILEVLTSGASNTLMFELVQYVSYCLLAQRLKL